MLGIALKQIHPKADVTMINAGISGHTTVNALARIDRDVISHQPDVVTVMFGLNDVGKNVSIEDYQQKSNRDSQAMPRRRFRGGSL